MKSTNFRKWLYASTFLLLVSSTAQASTLFVNCGVRSGGGTFTSIGAALKALQHSENGGPSTISVSGACNENVSIQNIQQLTLNGVAGASVSDASNGNADVIDVGNSHVTISGLTINGGVDGIACYNGSFCQLLGNTIQGASDNAILIYQISRATITGGVLQHNAGGLAVQGDAVVKSLTVQNNTGIGVALSNGGRLSFGQSVSKDNLGYGIWVQGSNLTCRACTVSGDQDVGVYLDFGSVAMFSGYAGPISISSYGAGVGVLLADLTIANFQGTVSVTGGGGAPAIQCNSATSVTRNAITAAGGAANTNCTN